MGRWEDPPLCRPCSRHGGPPPARLPAPFHFADSSSDFPSQPPASSPHLPTCELWHLNEGTLWPLGGDVAFSNAVTQAPLLSPQNSPPPSRPPRQKRCAPSAQLHIPVTPHVIFLSNEAAGTGLSNLALLHINAQSWAARGRVVA